MTIKVKKEIVEIADKLVRYRIARSRSHAFNILIEKRFIALDREIIKRSKVISDVLGIEIVSIE